MNIIINIYWEHLSPAGKETLTNAGFKPTEGELAEIEPIGAIVTGYIDVALAAIVPFRIRK